MKPKLRISSVQERAAVITSEMMGDVTAKRVTISSNEPYLREDEDGELYYEVLGHGPGEVDDSRLRLGLPILWNHKDDIHLGRSTKYTNNGTSIDVGTLDDLIWTEGEFSSNKKRDVEKGALVGTSVGYNVSRGEQVAMKDGVPVIKFQWKPYEFSWCPVEADTNCGAGRSVSHEAGEPEILEIPVNNNEKTGKKIDGEPVNQQKAQSDMNPTAFAAPRVFRNKDESGGGTATVTRTAEDVAAEKQRITELAKAEAKEMRKRDAERQRQIKETGQDFGIEEAVITRFVEDEDMSHEHFMREVQKIQRERSKGTNVSVVHESSPSTQRHGASSGIVGVRLSPGAKLVQDKGFLARHADTGSKREFSVKSDISILGNRGKSALMARAGWNTSELAAVNTTIESGMTTLGRERLTVFDLLMPGSTDRGSITYLRENSFGTVNGAAPTAGQMARAQTVAERGLKPLWEPDLETRVAPVKKIAITTRIPDEFLADISGTRTYVDGTLTYMVDAEGEWQCVYGDGVGSNIEGITTAEGILTRAYATSWGDTVKKSKTDILKASFFQADGMFISPDDWEVASLEKDLNGQYLAGGPFYAPYGNGVYAEIYRFCGLDVVVSTVAAVGKPIIGAWKMGAQYYLNGGLRLDSTNANEDDFRRNLIMIRAEERLALVVRRPHCFLEVTGGPART